MKDIGRGRRQAKTEVRLALRQLRSISLGEGCGYREPLSPPAGSGVVQHILYLSKAPCVLRPDANPDAYAPVTNEFGCVTRDCGSGAQPGNEEHAKERPRGDGGDRNADGPNAPSKRD